MEIILLQDMENLGYADDLISVKPGYARNFLIPKGMAVVANADNKAKLEERIKVRKAEEEKLMAEVREVVKAVEAATIKVGGKTGTSGKLFGSVTTLQLSDAIKAETGYEIDRRKINIVDDVKELGTYKAEISLPKETNVEFEFEVVSE